MRKSRFLASGDGLEMLEQGLGLGAEAPPFEFGTLIIEVGQDTIWEWASRPRHAIEVVLII